MVESIQFRSGLWGRLETERGPLIRPGHRKVHQALDAKAAGQPSFDRSLDEGRGKKGERQRHADRALCLLLARGDGRDGAARISYQFVLPAMGVAKRIDEKRARLSPPSVAWQGIARLLPE
jgi:hypothetical protein